MPNISINQSMIPYKERDNSTPQMEDFASKARVEQQSQTQVLETNNQNQQARHNQITDLNAALLGGVTRLSPIPINGTTLGSGVAAGGLGALNNQDIILTIERPIWYKPKDYSKLVGYPTDKAVRLGSLEGFCVISKCHLRCAATLEEQNMIMEHFRQGVIF